MQASGLPRHVPASSDDCHPAAGPCNETALMARIGALELLHPVRTLLLSPASHMDAALAFVVVPCFVFKREKSMQIQDSVLVYNKAARTH